MRRPANRCRHPIRMEISAMFPTRTAAFVTVLLATVLLAASAHAGAGKDTRYLDLINRAHDSVTSLEVAPAGSGDFREKPLGAPLRGGGDSTTIEIAGESCLYDIRL